MNWKLTLVLLLAADISYGAYTSPYQLVSKLNRDYNFDLSIYLSVDINRIVLNIEDINYMTPKTIIVLDNDKIEKFTKRGNNILLIVTLNSEKFERNIISLELLKKLVKTSTKIRIAIFYDFGIVPNNREILDVFKWCWSYRVINVISTYFINDRAYTFTYNPFDAFKVVNLTESTSDTYFMSKIENLHGYPIKMYLYKDLASFSKINNTKFGCPFGKLYSLMLQALNATLQLPREIRLYDVEEMKQQISVQKIFDIIPQSNRVLSSVSYLYPIEMGKMYILVPASKPHTVIHSLTLKFFGNSHIYGLLLLIISLTMTSLTIIKLIQSGKFMVLQSFTQISLTLSTASNYINFSKLTRCEIVLLMPWNFVGLITTNFMFSLLFSYLTVATFDQPVDTLAGIEKLECNIQSPARGMAESIRTAITPSLYNKFYLVNIEDFTHDLVNYNQSSCYLLPESRVTPLLEHQKKLRMKGGFHLPKQYLSKVHYSFLVRPDLPYIEKMNDVILRSFDSGLHMKWRSDVYYELLEMNYFPKVPKNNEELNTTDTYVLCHFIVYGWILSILCFICEVVCFRIQCCF